MSARSREIAERQARIRRVEERLGDKVICGQCGATLATYADNCSAPLDVRCPGFEAIEEARKP